MATQKNNIVDIDLSVTNKKQFRIDGDDERILELNTSDVSILSRLQDSYPKLDALGMKAISISSEETNKEETVQILKEVDEQMRAFLDFIFDSDVSEKCAPNGTMFDMFNGEFRFEHIVNTLIALYGNNLDKETKLMMKKIKKHTDKYTGK